MMYSAFHVEEVHLDKYRYWELQTCCMGNLTLNACEFRAVKWNLEYGALCSFSRFSTSFLFCFTLITCCVHEREVISFQIDDVEESRLFVRVFLHLSLHICANERTNHSSLRPSGQKHHTEDQTEQATDIPYIFTVFKSVVNEGNQICVHALGLNQQYKHIPARLLYSPVLTAAFAKNWDFPLHCTSWHCTKSPFSAFTHSTISIFPLGLPVQRTLIFFAQAVATTVNSQSSEISVQNADNQNRNIKALIPNQVVKPEQKGEKASNCNALQAIVYSHINSL